MSLDDESVDPLGVRLTRMVEGRRYVVAVCMDRKGERLMGSAHVAEHFDYGVDDVAPGDEVDLLVYGRTEAGIQVVVDRRHRGLVHHSNVHRKLPVGTELRGFVDQVRQDNRLDITLARHGMEGMQDAQEPPSGSQSCAAGEPQLLARAGDAHVEEPALLLEITRDRVADAGRGHAAVQDFNGMRFVARGRRIGEAQRRGPRNRSPS